MAKEVLVFLLVLGVTFFQRARSEGHIEINFKNYRSDCGDCDPMFTFCVDRPSTELSVDSSKCSYGRAGESDHYHNAGSIDFVGNFKGITNPWKVRFGRLHEKSIMLVARTRDDDIFGADHMATWGKVLTEKVYPTEKEARYVRRRMQKNDHVLTFEIKIYCIENFYGWDCSRRCIPQDKQSGHYTCDTATGDKICLKGWKGANCASDIDECELGFCERGECKNKLGDYECICPDNFSGRNCTIMGDPCELEPCFNNGTCTAVQDVYNYTCDCEEPWTGHDCELRRSPCEDKPCLHSGKCISNENNTDFTCRCKHPYIGPLCEEKLEPPKATTTPLPPRDPQRVSGKESSKGFVYWHGLLIGLVFILVLIAIILFFLVRRRRKDKKQNGAGLPPGDAVAFNGGNLAFENTMYNSSSNRGNSHNHTNGAIRQHPPLPTTPTDDELFNPVKPVGFFDVNETQGATGGYDEEGGYMKPSAIEKELKAQEAESVENQRAQDNQYSDFNAMTDKQRVGAEKAEPHYQDLDEVAIAFQGLDGETRDDVDLVEKDPAFGHSPRTTAKLKNMAGLPLEFGNNTYISSSASSSGSDDDNGESAMRTFGIPASSSNEHQYSEPTMSASAVPGNAGLLAPPSTESPYTEVPSNTPVLGMSSGPPVVLNPGSGPYSPIDDESEFDFALAQRVSSRRQPQSDEGAYAEPAVPASPFTENSSPAIPDFKNQPYAEMFAAPVNRTPSNRLTEDDVQDDEDDIPNVGLPVVNAGYAPPIGSFSGNPREPVYADPKDPDNGTPSGNDEYASPRTSGEPPDVPPKPQAYITSGSQPPSNYEEVRLSKQANGLPPAPSLPLPPTPEEIKHFNDETDSPRPLVAVPGHTSLLRSDSDANVDDDNAVLTSTKHPALFLENHAFSDDEAI